MKVHYTFDKDGLVHCLARWPHTLQIQTIPLDERTTIGVVDLRTCLQAVAQCSPEIVNQHQTDYSVYAYDYSEPDVPLVGQGMLSWVLNPHGDPQQHPQQQQLVTGRVTRNLLAILGNGNRETLEVKLKLTAVTRMVQRTDYTSMDTANVPKSAPTPAETTSEWSSFIQSNPMLGHAANVPALSSPALAPAQLNQFPGPANENRPMDGPGDSHGPQPIRPASIPPANPLPPVPIPPANRAPSAAPASVPAKPQGPAENAPSPASTQGVDLAPQPRPSRPSSRSRSKQPTGRPRGRPRKKPLETGNTSAAEEATDGDEGPQKKRAKVTQTHYSPIAPFGAVPESLRVAASTADSIRNLRPVGAGGDAPAASHVQDGGPRPPTPMPAASLLQQQQQRRRAVEEKARSESFLGVDQSGPARSAVQHLIQDARSPAESVAQSPDHGYSPEDSAGDLGSSPPVPRTTAYIQSSPPASSPVLPAMPMPQIDSGFMSGGLEDFFEDEDMMQDLQQGQTQEQMLPVPPLPVPNKQNNDGRKNGSTQQPQRQQRHHQQQQQTSNFPFQEVHPGPPELLPTRSIFNPAGRAKALNRPAPPASGNPVPKKANSRSLKRSHTAPNPVVSEQEPPPQEQPANWQSGKELPQDPAKSLPPHEQTALPSGAAGSAQPTGDGGESGQTEASRQPEPAAAATRPMPIPERPEPEPVLSMPTAPVSRPPSRPASRGPAPAIPASDPVGEPPLTLPQPFMSEAPCPPSDPDPPRYSKNLVKKLSIKERLESAIERGESPPYCNNCGAIETPTWRKIWTQDRDGFPIFYEFSDKPGAVTMIEVLERDAEGQPSKHRLVKKNLGPQDDKKQWTETLLCNPCGIWLAKFKVHRPPDRWDKDAARLNQPRKKREQKGSSSRSKKARTKSDAKGNPTSEAYLTTDPIGPADQESPTEHRDDGEARSRQQQGVATAEERPLNLRSSPKQRLPGSTHSRGSGTADSPIAVEDDLGSTRRLLFPSPRKDGVPKVLGELSVNTVQTTTQAQEAKSATAGKENGTNGNNRSGPERPGTPVPEEQGDLEQELFGTPPKRPSTPPPKASAGSFKTPTRPTPSHRPITRSISRSIRSIRSMPKSPSQLLAQHLQQTPSKTPRSTAGPGGPGSSSAGRRRSPRKAHAQVQSDDGDDAVVQLQFDSPFTATLHQLLSEANEFTAGSPSHGLEDFDLSSLAQLGGEGGLQGQQQQQQQHQRQQQQNAALDFGNFFGGDLAMPSSPPLLRSREAAGADEFGAALPSGGGELWTQQQLEDVGERKGGE